METIRIGNTIIVRWTFVHSDNSVFPLDRYSVDLFYYTGRGRSKVNNADFSIDGNVLTWTFVSVPDSFTGPYFLEAKVYNGTAFIGSFTKKDAFLLTNIGECFDEPVEVSFKTITDKMSVMEAVELARRAADSAFAAAALAGVVIRIKLTDFNEGSNKIDTWYLGGDQQTDTSTFENLRLLLANICSIPDKSALTLELYTDGGILKAVSIEEVADSFIISSIYGKLKLSLGLSASDNFIAHKALLHPYLSLERLHKYLYRVTFDSLPEDNGSNSFVPAGCSSYVKDGKLYRNLDFKYDNSASFIVRTKDFEGMSFTTGLNDGEMNDDSIAQLPYHVVDGVNYYGIKVSTHILFNDWDWGGQLHLDGIPLTRLPFEVLTRVKTMDNIQLALGNVVNNLNKPVSMGDYLLQVLVTDGATTYAIMPPESAFGSYQIVNITNNPKLTNFRWLDKVSVERSDQDIQERPTGIERWNMMPCKLKDLRFTKAYESPNRLSEFIGIDGTTKDSTDAELTAIYNIAHTRFENRTREDEDATWQTMHSVVYGDKMEELYIQEDWKNNCISVAGGAVRYDEEQHLDEEEKNQARKNIEAVSSCGDPESATSVVPYIAYTPQILTDAQKYQARMNIGAQEELFENGDGANAVQQKCVDEFLYHEGQEDERTIQVPEPTQATGENSMAVGIGTKASGQGAYAEGHISVEESGGGDILGQTISSGRGSHAEGCGTEASDTAAHAEGYNTKATKGTAHAEGELTEANGYHSHAEGYKSVATGTSSHVEGQETKALKDNGHAEGDRSEAQGIASHAEGRVSKAIGTISHAEGYYSEAKNDYSHAEGYQSIAEGNRSHAEGNKTHTLATAAHAEGESTLAKQKAGHTEGYQTVVTDNKEDRKTGEDNNNKEYGHAEGDSTCVSAHAGHAEGLNSLCDGKYGHAEGWGTEVYNAGGHAEGHNTLAGTDPAWSPNPRAENRPDGWFAHAEGDATNAKGYASHAEGVGTKTTYIAEHAEGKFNDSHSALSDGGIRKTIHSVGIGTGTTDRKNAYEILDNGEIYICGVGGYDGRNPTPKVNSLQKVLEGLGVTIDWTKLGY